MQTTFDLLTISPITASVFLFTSTKLGLGLGLGLSSTTATGVCMPALSRSYHNLYLCIFFFSFLFVSFLVVNLLTIAVLSPSVEHCNVPVTRVVNVAEGFFVLGRYG